MKAILCIMTSVLLLTSGNDGGEIPGKIESMIRSHIGQCEADGLNIPVVMVAPELFNKLVAEVGWRRVRGNSGHRRWVVFETPDLTRKSGKRHFRVEQYPTPDR